MQFQVNFKVNENIYLKDPESSEVGKQIIRYSIDLIYSLRFEQFTFKKLAAEIGTTEATIYRYFENKHKLLIYLSSWYWSWMEYRLVFTTNNLAHPLEKLKKAITLVTEKAEDDSKTTHINESILNNIIVAEFTKTLHTKEVDKENIAATIVPNVQSEMPIL